jgi:hypothetical protein
VVFSCGFFLFQLAVDTFKQFSIWLKKDALRACAASRTWSKELPFILLGLRAQPKEDTGLSPAEAVFGAPIVLPNEFLQNEEISVDSINKKFSKTLDVPVASLPRHNSSNQL